jgi:HK97 family phage prohead protease
MSAKEAAAPDRVFHFIASDGSIDRMGDVIAPQGWQLSAFRKNPVVLFAHDSASLPCGRAVDVGIEGNKLVASIRFAQTAMGRTVAGMIGGGFLRAESVGFKPVKFAFAKSASRQGGIDFAEQELLEISIVPIPANPNALLQNIGNGNGNGNGKGIGAKAKRRLKLELALVKVRLAPPLPKVRTLTKRQRPAELAAIKRAT